MPNFITMKGRSEKTISAIEKPWIDLKVEIIVHENMNGWVTK